MKHGRRGNREGTVSRVLDAQGRTTGWKGAVSYVDIETGQTKRKWFRGATRDALKMQMDGFRQQTEKFGGLPNQTRTVEVYLREWVEERRHVVALKTYEDYQRVVETRLIPALGAHVLAKLVPGDIQRMVNNLVKSGKPAEARRALARLRMALGDALRLQLVTVNAAEHVLAPDVQTATFGIWQPEQVRTFLAETRGRRVHALYAVLLGTGLRSGEARGLRWINVDLDVGLIHVREQWIDAAKASESRFGPPKRGSARDVRISAELVQTLREHRERQNGEREKAGPLWKDHGLVFPTAVGTPQGATNMTRQFRTDVARAGVPVIRIHDLRDTAASTMLAAATPLTVVAEILGHRDTNVTLRRYVHTLDHQRRAHPAGTEMYGADPEETRTSSS